MVDPRIAACEEITREHQADVTHYRAALRSGRWFGPILFTVTATIIGVLVLFVFPAIAKAADQEDRDRKARVALALAGVEAKSATAPAPRPKLICYPNSYAKAVRENLPLVVWVGCEGQPVEGAITCRMPSLPDVKGPAVMVAYPAGDQVLIDKLLPCPPQPGTLTEAVKEAAKHAGTKGKPGDKPAPLPLDWKSALGGDAEEQPIGFRRRASTVLPSGPAVVAKAPSAASPKPEAPPAVGLTASIQPVAPACANGQCAMPAAPSRPVLRRLFGR